MGALRKALLVAGAWVGLSAQTAPPPEPLQLIREQVRPVEIAPSGGFGGAGWEALLKDASTAQFVMVGEQHGSGSIAHFEDSLFRTLSGRGFTHLALEIGPFSTRAAEAMIRSGPGKLQAYIAQPGHGFVIPFLFFLEEADMAEAMVGTSPDRKQALFGLDQEFVGAGALLSAELGRLAATTAQKDAAAAFASAAAGDPMLVSTLDDAKLAGMQQAFQGNEEALEIADAMRTSARIYGPFMGRGGSGYEANLARETYMKRNFLAQFDAARKRNGVAPRVLFKFGGYHAMRGFSGTNVPALANFLAEWGTADGYRTVNLMVDCVGGEAMNPQTGKAAPCESYFAADNLLYKATDGGPDTQIIDLRALRPSLGKLKMLNDETRKTILAFDYYVVIRNGAAATPLGSITTDR